MLRHVPNDTNSGSKTTRLIGICAFIPSEMRLLPVYQGGKSGSGRDSS